MSNAALAFDEFAEDIPPDEGMHHAANQFVTFSVGANSYGIDIMAVREIRSWTSVTQLPDQASGAMGVLDIRGNIVEVFDLSIVLGSGIRETPDNQVVLGVAIDGNDVGLAVDSVSDIVDADGDDFAEPPQKGGKIATIVRQNEQLISVLDLTTLLG